MNAVLVALVVDLTSIAKKPCIFVNFQEGGPGPLPPPPLDPPMFGSLITYL